LSSSVRRLASHGNADVGQVAHGSEHVVTEHIRMPESCEAASMVDASGETKLGATDASRATTASD